MKGVGARDPVRAWELWLQFRIKERLDGILAVLATIAVAVVGGVLLELQILAKM